MNVWLEGLIFGSIVAPLVLLMGCGIKRVLRYELEQLTPEEIVAMHQGMYGRRKSDKRMKELTNDHTQITNQDGARFYGRRKDDR